MRKTPIFERKFFLPEGHQHEVHDGYITRVRRNTEAPSYKQIRDLKGENKGRNKLFE